VSGSTRLDVLMAERGIAESRSRAQALIMAGRVLVEGAVVTKAGSAVPETARVATSRAAATSSRRALRCSAST
jgi:23S rRNA (cytidine1920-2'-O)/16S rRNA (cytidine1409-2'-O)-methyltransferase